MSMLELVELEGDHTEAERAELHDGEENAFESIHLGIEWEDHERRLGDPRRRAHDRLRRA